MKRVTCLIGLLLLASPIAAQEPVEEREHVVRRGDTLWDLAGYYFSDPFEWPSIYEANTSVVEDPHWIYPEEVLVIPGLQRVADAADEPERERPPRVAVRSADRPARTVFYRQPAPQDEDGSDPTILTEPAYERVPVRPGEFNSAPFVDHPSALVVVGNYISALRENRNVGGAPTAHPKDEVFLGYEGDYRPEVDQRVMLIEVGDRVRGTPGGHRALLPTGVVRITQLGDDVMQGRIETQYRAVHPGQLAVPMPTYPDFDVEEARPFEAGGFDLEGQVLQFLSDPPIPGLADVAFVNLGSDQGVSVGDVFTAYLPERPSRERRLGDFLSRIEQLPPGDVGRLRVLQVTPDVATVRVDELFLPSLQDGVRVRRTHTVR